MLGLEQNDLKCGYNFIDVDDIMLVMGNSSMLMGMEEKKHLKIN